MFTQLVAQPAPILTISETPGYVLCRGDDVTLLLCIIRFVHRPAIPMLTPAPCQYISIPSLCQRVFIADGNLGSVWETSWRELAVVITSPA